MIVFYFMLACGHIGLLTGITIDRQDSFRLTALIFLMSMLWPALLAGFFYVKWRHGREVNHG